MGICYIVGAADTTCMLHQSMIQEDDYVIAADGGYQALQNWEISPRQIVGDFDSLGFIPSGEQVVRYPSEKDDTDMMIAVKVGLDKGYKRFVIFGGLGGRLDHTIANLHVLDYLAEHEARGCLAGDHETVLLVKGDSKVVFDKSAAGEISIFAYGGKAEGVFLSGLKYPLEDALLTTDFPIGVSNVFMGVESDISVRNGKLLIMWTGAADLYTVL